MGNVAWTIGEKSSFLLVCLACEINCVQHFSEVRGSASSVAIATELRAGRSGIESRFGRDFPPVQTGTWGTPSLL